MRAYRLMLFLTTLVAASAVPAQNRRGEPDRPISPPMQLPKRPLAEVLRMGPVRTTIGQDDEDGPYMFAGMGAMALGGDGTVFIAEYSTFEIRAFDQSGRHLATFGRRGRGPGEFV